MPMSQKRNTNVQILLDHKQNQTESLLSAALLAKTLKVQLQGLFIEEEALLRAAAFPLASEISLRSGKERHITGDGMQRILRSHARRLQGLVEKVAHEKRIDYTFQIIRGEKSSWLKENRNTSEILFIGGHEPTMKSHRAFKYCSEIFHPLVAIFDGSIGSDNALKTALQIAENNNKPLHIFFLDDGLLAENAKKEQLEPLIKNHAELLISIETISKTYLTELLQRRKINLLIFSSDSDWVKDHEGFIHYLSCPSLIVT